MVLEVCAAQAAHHSAIWPQHKLMLCHAAPTWAVNVVQQQVQLPARWLTDDKGQQFTVAVAFAAAVSECTRHSLQHLCTKQTYIETSSRRLQE